MVLDRSLVIKMGLYWEAQMDEMNRSKREQPFAYADLLMGGTAYIRWMIGKDVRITEGIANGMLGRSVKGWPKPTTTSVRIFLVGEIVHVVSATASQVIQLG